MEKVVHEDGQHQAHVLGRRTQEARSPMSLTNSYAFPGSVTPRAIASAPEGLAEGAC